MTVMYLYIRVFLSLISILLVSIWVVSLNSDATLYRCNCYWMQFLDLIVDTINRYNW